MVTAEAQSLAASALARRASGRRKSFYRPELDALRFFAFAATLAHHGPYAPGLPAVVMMVGGFGVSMFFLLSAYLITELLLRERAGSGSVAWSLFFVRRALRIWPLYYAALAVAILIGLANPHFALNGFGIAGMSFFFVNWVLGGAHLGFLGSLWSISVEEQFYLIWPPIVRAGGKRLVLIASIGLVVGAGVWLWVFAGKGWHLWYDTPVEFLFFGAGAIVALAARGEIRARSRTSRVAIFIAGWLLLVVAAQAGGIGTSGVRLTHSELYIGYGAAVAGCAAIFVAILGLPHIPPVLIYLGRISYGLYVFHEGALYLAQWTTAPLKLRPASVVRMLTVDMLALLICIPLAHLSYQYFEKPFLKLKQRFEVVESRPA